MTRPDTQMERPAPDLAKRKILITGANGFIGRAMAERFRALGDLRQCAPCGGP